MDDFQRREVKYRDYQLVLAAGVSQDIAVRGDYWQLIKTPAGEVTIELDETVRIMRVAPSGGPGNYSRVRVTSTVDQTVVLALGTTNGLVPYDNRTVITGTLSVNQAIPTLANGLGDVAITAGSTGTFAASATRDTIIISLDDAAPDYVRVVSGGVGNGVRLYPGGSISLRTTAAVQVRNPNAVTVTVSATETANP